MFAYPYERKLQVNAHVYQQCQAYFFVSGCSHRTILSDGIWRFEALPSQSTACKTVISTCKTLCCVGIAFWQSSWYHGTRVNHGISASFFNPQFSINLIPRCHADFLPCFWIASWSVRVTIFFRMLVLNVVWYRKIFEPQGVSIGHCWYSESAYCVYAPTCCGITYSYFILQHPEKLSITVGTDLWDGACCIKIHCGWMSAYEANLFLLFTPSFSIVMSIQAFIVIR